MGLLDQILGGLSGNDPGSPLGTRRDDIGSGSGTGAGVGQIITALLPVVLGMLANRSNAGGGTGMGGLGGLLEQFTQRGYGSQAHSWVGTGANQPLAPEAIDDVFGADQLSQIAQRAGISTDDARMGLSHILPDAVDHLTPNGHVPSMDSLSSSVDDFLGRLSGGRGPN